MQVSAFDTTRSLGKPSRAARVLLAEDNPINRRVVALVLAAAGVELDSVENGREAVTAFQGATYDLVLMDVQMPEMDGLTAIKAMRDYERAQPGARTPIFTVTANALPQDVAASHGAGADRHISKPMTPAGLLEALGEALAMGTEARP